jgi:hypothetical protein
MVDRLPGVHVAVEKHQHEHRQADAEAHELEKGPQLANVSSPAAPSPGRGRRAVRRLVVGDVGAQRYPTAWRTS